MKHFLLLLCAGVLFSCNSATDNTSGFENDTTATETEPVVDLLDTTGGKGVFFTELKDSQEVKSPVKVKMSVVGMEVEAAGPINDLKGHHHILIDGAPIAEGAPVPLDDRNLHFGKGQTESDVTLTPGYHTLTLQFANGVHASYGPRWSRTITVLVK